MRNHDADLESLVFLTEITNKPDLFNHKHTISKFGFQFSLELRPSRQQPVRPRLPFLRRQFCTVEPVCVLIPNHGVLVRLQS